MSIKHTFIVKEGTETKVITKAKAIRLHCMDCSGWQTSEIVKCTCHTCALYPFRFGNEKGLERWYDDEKEVEKEETDEVDIDEVDEDEEWDNITEEDEVDE